MKTVVKVLCWVLAVVLFAGGIAVILAFTNGGNEEFKTFYIERDGKKILASETEDAFCVRETVEYGVKYTFNVGLETKDYIVKVVPNEDANFAYSVDGADKEWKNVGELSGDNSALFMLEKEADRFLLSFGTDYLNGMEDVMAMLYPRQSVVLPDDFDDAKPYFTLYVASYNESVKFYVNFSLQEAQRVQVEWCLSNPPCCLTNVKQFHVGDVIGTYRPEGYENWVWYTDGEPYDFSQVLTHDLVLFGREGYGISYVVNDLEGAGFSTSMDVRLDCVPCALAGDEVWFSVGVPSNYEIVGIYAKDSFRGDVASVIKHEDGRYSFTMPAQDVVLEVLIQREKK